MDIEKRTMWTDKNHMLKLKQELYLLLQKQVEAQKMTALIPTSQPSGVEAYEDMFKEITRKLYGEETGHGLHTLGTPVAHVATGGPTAPEGERSFTTLISDRSLTTIDYDHVGTESNNLFKTDDHLTTAFGLAALMQNGFPPPGAILNPHNFTSSKPNSITSTSAATSITGATANTTTSEEKWPPPSEECLPWATNKVSTFSAPQKLFKVKKQEPNTHESTHPPINNSTPSIIVKSQPNSNTSTTPGQKRYNCSSCPYSTDRRDLFTRHENIHKEEKPFHCYVCLKQFNRADHVKKHFLRMHRGLAYDISRTKRLPSNNRKTSNYFPQSNTESGQQNHQQTSTLNIPVNTYQSGAQNSQPNQSHPQSGGHQNQQHTGAGTNSESSNANSSNIQQQSTMKTEKNEKASKRKGEKRFVCCYCPWSGTDNWGLKRHLNTHTKPYVCMLCDYKAARSERLATHVFKVHNKKVCGKCNFLADTQEEYQTHVNEAHAHDTRPQRCLTNGTDSTANVLRTIGNSFNIPNSQLNTIHNASTAHIFGSSTSNIQPSNNSSIYSNNNLTTNSMTDNINNQNNLANNWRPTTTSSIMSSGVESNSNIQKRGAERLFQYMEADGSDPEDYTRQLQMAALSRNTATVAQDFHNAGGGVKSFIHQYPTSAEETKANNMSVSVKMPTLAVAFTATTTLPSVSTATTTTTPPTNVNNKNFNSMAFKSVSSPATNPTTKYINNNNHMNQNGNGCKQQLFGNTKKRRRSHEKENENIFLNESNFAQINSLIYSKLSSRFESDQNVMQKLHFEPIADKQEYLMRQSFKLASHPELEVIINEEPPTMMPEKRNRKQSQPRKIEIQYERIDKNDQKIKIEGNDTKSIEFIDQKAQIFDRILDKHLNRMVSSKRKRCNNCTSKVDYMIIPYHTKSSLILHKFWRHTSKRFGCNQRNCDQKFNLFYKLKLHKRFMHKLTK